MSVYYSDESVTIHHGDCVEVLATLPAASVDAVVCDPPYGLEFMGKEWDAPWKAEARAASATVVEAASVGGFQDGNGGNAFSRSRVRTDTARHGGDVKAANRGFQDWCELWAAECLRVLKPGGHMLAFGGTRTYHRLACAVEDAGFEIRDSISWLYGSGFPKSLDVSKAIDKAAGAERNVVGTKLGLPGYSLTDGNGDHRTYSQGLGNTGSGEAECAITAPATDEAKRWAGWGTALKPAHEPIVVARKPLAGTVAGNVAAHGTGAINVDACRVGTGGQLRWAEPRGMGYHGGSDSGTVEALAHSLGRWPTNVVLDQSQADALDAETGVLTSGKQLPTHSRHRQRMGSSGIYGASAAPEQDALTETYGDSGGASRFFPTFRYEAKAPQAERPRDGATVHPTVKPLDLMRWLVRLVTPRGGLVLDPFLGSGTTAEACVLEGLRCIGIEREADYLPLTVARLSKPLQVGFDFGASA